MQIKIPPLVGIFTEMSDWRKARGLRYSLSSLLALLVFGLLCGKKGARETARWCKGLPEQQRQRVGLRAGRWPSAATLCRVLWQVVVTEMEAEIANWAEEVHRQLVAAGVSRGIAIDGKSIRRAASLGAQQVHLLSAVCHQLRFVLAQVAVDDKSNEIKAIGPLLERLLLKGLVVTVDALLTQKRIARQIRQQKGHYIMYVKDNQPKLRWAIEYLFTQPRKAELPSPATARTVEKGHGRLVIREIAASTALNEYLNWPGLAQVFQLRRSTTSFKQGKTRVEVVYGVTSLPSTAASPAQLLAHIRDHWAASENGLHWVRDVVMGEDAHTLRKATAPQTMAALRNLVISVVRLAGFDSITAARDACSADSTQALQLMGL
jgi:predicted transposase YbfD/YdcC